MNSSDTCGGDAFRLFGYRLEDRVDETDAHERDDGREHGRRRVLRGVQQDALLIVSVLLTQSVIRARATP